MPKSFLIFTPGTALANSSGTTLVCSGSSECRTIYGLLHDGWIDHDDVFIVWFRFYFRVPGCACL